MEAKQPGTTTNVSSAAETSIPGAAASPNMTAAAAAASALGGTTATPTTPGKKGKVLIILSSSDHVTLEGGKSEPTGFFMNELCTPLTKMLADGWEVEFANPMGTMPATDPVSKSLLWYLGSSAARDKHQDLLERMKVESNFGHPKRFAAITEEELQSYAGVFIPGGHAPMEDLHSDQDLARILRYFHRSYKPTGAICHGPVAFLSMTDPKDHTSPFPYTTYHMTAYTNMEEALNELKWFHRLKLHVQTELEKHGVLFESAMLPMGSKVVEDRELLTAQNPSSASAFAEAFVKKLNRKETRRGSASSAKSQEGKVIAVQQS